MVSFSVIDLKTDGGATITYLAEGTPGQDEIEFSDKFKDFRARYPDAHRIDVFVWPYCYGYGELKRADSDHLALIAELKDSGNKVSFQPLLMRNYSLPGQAV